MDGHACAAPDPAPTASPVVPLVRLVIPRAAWAYLADAMRAAVRGTDVTWAVRRTAVSAVVPNGSAVLEAALRGLGDVGLAPVIVDAAAPQCLGCGCVDALACDGGCGWVGRARCSACVGEQLGQKRLAKARIRRRNRRGRA